MASIEKYAWIAFCVYEVSDADKVAGFNLRGFEAGTWYGNGFQGGIYETQGEVICGFKGTKPGVFGKNNVGFGDLTADLRIGLGILPNQCGGAYRMVKKAKALAKGRPLSVCGHSLGGALAQVVAVWANLPFVSFNSPGMKYEIALSKFNFMKPLQMARSWNSPSSDTIQGWNFRIDGDPVSCFGHHVGTEVSLAPKKQGLGLMDKHSMVTVLDALSTSQWGGMEAFYW